jgi:hypothetical protein
MENDRLSSQAVYQPVFSITMVVVAGDIAVTIVGDSTGQVSKRIPDRCPRPSSSVAPSIWYDAVADPHRKSCGNFT